MKKVQILHFYVFFLWINLMLNDDEKPVVRTDIWVPSALRRCRVVACTSRGGRTPTALRGAARVSVLTDSKRYLNPSRLQLPFRQRRSH